MTPSSRGVSFAINGKGQVGAIAGAQMDTDNEAIKPVIVIYGGYVGVQVSGGVVGDYLTNILKSKFAVENEKKIKVD